jgi:tetratricopeptide (TPR) repeat protein
LIGAATLMVWGSVTLAGNVSDEARRYMARGTAAVEMAKSPGDYVLAIKEFEQAARLAPDWPVIHYNLGSVQSRIGDYASAMKSYQRYLELAPQSPDAEKVREEIYKLEYRRDQNNMATMLAGTWTASDGQTFKLLLDGSRLQLTRDQQQNDDIVHLRSMGKTYTSSMPDAPPLVFLGMLVGDKISGQYLLAHGKGSVHCDIPERKGNFEGTIDVASGWIRIVYNRVTLEYKMEFESFFSDVLVCRQTDRKETPGYVLELKHSSLPAAQTGK